MTRRMRLDTPQVKQPADRLHVVGACEIREPKGDRTSERSPAGDEGQMPWWASRRNRSRLRTMLRQESRFRRVRDCGVVSRRAEGVGIAVDMSAAPGARIAGLRGLVSCGSVWLCPRCAAVIGQARSTELRRGIEEWESRGNRVVFLTLTIGHSKNDSLSHVWDGIAPAWSEMNRHRQWKAIKERAGVEGFVRAVEATWSFAHGWHVHAHLLLFVRDAQLVLDETNAIKSLWMKIARRNGYEARPLAQDLRPATAGDAYELASYVNKGPAGKWSSSDELMRWSVKRGRGDSLAPFELLMHASHDDYDALLAWWAWEQGSHKRRQMTWSRGLRRELGLLDEQADEALALAAPSAPEDGPSPEEIIDSLDQGTPEVAGMPNKLWRKFLLAPEDMDIFLEAVEKGTTQEGRERLRELASERGWPLMIGDEWEAHRARYGGLRN